MRRRTRKMTLPLREGKRPSGVKKKKQKKGKTRCKNDGLYGRVSCLRGIKEKLNCLKKWRSAQKIRAEIRADPGHLSRKQELQGGGERAERGLKKRA